jgi:carbamoyl-phosphate synthase small subunit
VEDVPGVTGIDTRSLTRRLRERGTMRGWIHPADMPLEEARTVAHSVDLVQEVFTRVTPSEPVVLGSGDVTVLLIDVGAKDNLARSLLRRGMRVLRAPWHSNLPALAKKVDGILVGNGPGDPRHLEALTNELRAMLTGSTPMLGVCLGNQLLARAAGGDTYKLAYGHRGMNQPVQDLITGRCYITSQNHGFAVRDESLPADWERWFVNVNDGTNEGIRSRSRPHLGVQFHPEARPGPEDTSFLFDDFARLVYAARAR